MKRTVLLLAIVILSGCTMAQTRQELLGLSENDIRANKKRFVGEVVLPAGECYDKLIAYLTANGAVIIRSESNERILIASSFEGIYPNCINTTQAGIIVKESGSLKSRLEIVSGNYFLAEALASKLPVELIKKKKIAKDLVK